MKTLFFILFIFSLGQSAWAQRIVFIVNAENPITHLNIFQLSEIYLKKNRIWPDGSTIRFFDRGNESPERKLFLREIMKRSARELEQFWIGQKLYTGNSAPSQINADATTIALVSRFPGAISYVLEENFREDKGIKKIEVTGIP